MDGYYLPADSQLVSVRVQVFEEAGLCMTLSTCCEEVSDEFLFSSMSLRDYCLKVLLLEFYVEA